MYALSAHLDFVITEEATLRPVFAVEYDGPYHHTDGEARRRDRLKDALCDRYGLSLLRVDATLTAGRGRHTSLIAYLAEVWALDRAWQEGQQRGKFPRDEDFDPLLIIGDTAGRSWPFWLDRCARLLFHQACDHGRLVDRVPVEVHRRDGHGYVISDALIVIGRGRALHRRARLREFRFVGVLPEHLAGSIAVCELGEAYEAVLRGARAPTLDAAAIRRFAAAHTGGAWHWRTRSPETLLRLAGEG